MSALCQTVAKP